MPRTPPEHHEVAGHVEPALTFVSNVVQGRVLDVLST
jgi:hypothetical protein